MIFTIIYAGRLHLSKGVMYLLEAFRLISDHLPDIHLNIFGKDPLENKLVQTIIASGLKDRVSYLGYIPYNRLLMKIKKSEIVCFLASKNPSQCSCSRLWHVVNHF